MFKFHLGSFFFNLTTALTDTTGWPHAYLNKICYKCFEIHIMFYVYCVSVKNDVYPAWNLLCNTGIYGVFR